jgi:hypothetical protein
MDDAIPRGLSKRTHQDLEGRGAEVWIRRILLAALAAFILLGLLSIFGQHSTVVRAGGPGGTLTIESPDALRGGLVYQTKVTVTPGPNGVKEPKLVLSSGYLDGLTMNTMEPSPTEEKSVDGALVLSFGALEPDDTLTVWIDYQVNPTTVGARTQEMTLRDGERTVARASRRMEVYP